MGYLRSHHLRTPLWRLRLGVQHHARLRGRVWQPAGIPRYHGLLCRPYHHPLPGRFCHGDRCHQEWSRRADGKDPDSAFRQEVGKRAAGIHAHHGYFLHVYLQHRHSGDDAYLPHPSVQGSACQRQGTHRPDHGDTYRRQPGRYGYAYRHPS